MGFKPHFEQHHRDSRGKRNLNSTLSLSRQIRLLSLTRTHSHFHSSYDQILSRSNLNVIQRWILLYEGIDNRFPSLSSHCVLRLVIDNPCGFLEHRMREMRAFLMHERFSSVLICSHIVIGDSISGGFCEVMITSYFQLV